MPSGAGSDDGMLMCCSLQSLLSFCFASRNSNNDAQGFLACHWSLAWPRVAETCCLGVLIKSAASACSRHDCDFGILLHPGSSQQRILKANSWTLFCYRDIVKWTLGNHNLHFKKVASHTCLIGIKKTQPRRRLECPVVIVQPHG